MIRILHYIGSLQQGGSQAMIMTLYRNIDRNQIQFDFVIHADGITPLAEEAQALGATIYTCPQFCFSTAVNYCRWWWIFLREHPEYHIIHSHVRSTAAIVLWIANRFGCRTIAHSHSTNSGTGFNAIAKNLLQFPIRFIADYLFACSDIAGEWLFGKKAIKKENYKLIPNCVDLDVFRFRADIRRELRKKWNIDDDTTVIGHVGRMSYVKNHEFLVAVFSTVLQMHPGTRLLLVGDGEMRGAIEAQCEELEIADKVIFAGLQQDIAPFYSAMDVFVFPSLWEGLPVSVIEAQQSGLPCIISDTITEQIKLTDLVKSVPLKECKGKWAERVLKEMCLPRKALDTSQAGEIAKFDSKVVAQQMQNFYLSL